MLLYITLGTHDLARGMAFYDPVMATLGHGRGKVLSEGWARWGSPYDEGDSLWLCPPYDGRAASAGNGTMVAFRAESAAQVRAWHAAGLANGGQDEGAPGTRDDYGPEFYVAYLRDPDGHKLACVYHHYDKTRD